MTQQRRRVLVIPLPGNEMLGREIADSLSGAVAIPTMRRFPDEETYVRLDASVDDSDVVLTATLDRPDSKLFSAACDALVTVDPHLHRYSSLAELYTVPTHVVHAAALLSEWIKRSVKDLVLIRPDSESEQWVAEVARLAGALYVVLEKIRRGDRDVEVQVPDVERWISRRPVLVDDIISTARTMAGTARHLRRVRFSAPVCVGVHAVFAGDAYRHLSSVGVEEIITTDTIHHETNAIGVGHALADAVAELVG